MKSTRVIAPVVILMLLSIVVSTLSCGQSANISQLEGTWTIVTNPVSGIAFGNGTYTLTFHQPLPEFGYDIYSGDGLINNNPYKFSVLVWYEADEDGNDYYLNIYKDGEIPKDNSLECYGTLNRAGSGSASGQYTGGEGNYALYESGTFVTTRQEVASE